MEVIPCWDVNQTLVWSIEAGSQVAAMDHKDDLDEIIIVL